MTWDKDNQNNPPIWVIKIGGSLLGSPALGKWLTAIAKYTDGRVVIVPGGGVFADAVRDAQALSGIDDADAHHLALLAMDQYGLLMANMQDGLVTASSELELAERVWQHRGIVWLPSQMVLADETIPKNWQVTSDSISAWLASKMNASQLIIVKSALLDDKVTQGNIAYQTLLAAALVDEQLLDFVVGQSYQTWLVHKDKDALLSAGFNKHALETHGLLLDIHTH